MHGQQTTFDPIRRSPCSRKADDTDTSRRHLDTREGGKTEGLGGHCLNYKYFSSVAQKWHAMENERDPHSPMKCTGHPQAHTAIHRVCLFVFVGRGITVHWRVVQ